MTSYSNTDRHGVVQICEYVSKLLLLCDNVISNVTPDETDDETFQFKIGYQENKNLRFIQFCNCMLH